MNMPSVKLPVCQLFCPALNAVALYPLLGCASLDRDVRRALRTFGIDLWLFLLVLLELNGSDTQSKKKAAEKAY